MTQRMVLVYVDANVFITAFEAEPIVAAPARALLTAGQRRRNSLVTSELTIAEVLAPPSAPGSLPLIRKMEIYQTVLLWSAFIQVVPITRDVLLSTAALRSTHRQKLADAIHVVTALRSGCSHFCSADRDARRLPSNLILTLPDQAGISMVIATLDRDENTAKV